MKKLAVYRQLASANKGRWGCPAKHTAGKTIQTVVVRECGKISATANHPRRGTTVQAQVRKINLGTEVQEKGLEKMHNVRKKNHTTRSGKERDEGNDPLQLEKNWRGVPTFIRMRGLDVWDRSESRYKAPKCKNRPKHSIAV